MDKSRPGVPAPSPWISIVAAATWPDASCKTAVPETSVTVTFKLALWERLPLVASNWMERGPVCAAGGMNNTTC